MSAQTTETQANTTPALPSFFLFSFAEYYPAGGTEDLKSAHHDHDEAMAALNSLRLGSHEHAELAQVTPEGMKTIAYRNGTEEQRQRNEARQAANKG